MTAAKYSSEELDFRLTFGEDTQPTALGHTDVRVDNGGSCYFYSALQEQSLYQQHPELQYDPVTQPSQTPLTGSYAAPCSNAVDSPSRVFDCPSIQITSIPATCQQELVAQQQGVESEHDGASGPLVSRDQLYLPLDGSYRDTSGLCPSPCSSLSSRSWLSDASSCESFSHIYDDVEAELNEATAQCQFASPQLSPLGSPLPSPLASPQASPQVSPLVSPFGSPSCTFTEDSWFRYQQQQQRHYFHSLSPHHSPYQSPRASVTEDTWLSARPHSSSRPSSRPTSPYGKRPYSDGMPGSSSPHFSPSPSPSHSPRGSVTDDSWLGSPAAMAPPFQAFAADIDIPSKTRRTYQANHLQDRTTLLPGHVDPGLEEIGPATASLDSTAEVSLPTMKKEDIVEHFLSVPTPFPWGKPKQTHTPLFRSTSLPSLDSFLPSQHGQYELKLEIQPKSHHRAHYETEGSRGAIKSACGRHPIVKLVGYNEKPLNLQMFIGTADDRHVKPHAFYQVHRITGKTVATPSQEIVITSTKVLEIPLLPENNMSASIDCAGIMKLRNSDIELRKGETDIGRKNTRVRAVFRVHIPQTNGKVLSLQVASIPIECSQRSAQELPQIEHFSPNCGFVCGGQELAITGPNITPESKVFFLEKGHDWRTQWEVDAQTIREKSTDMTIVVKIPPYYKGILGSSTQVQFYVSNGKRKRSLLQRFTYIPEVQVKQEYDSVGDAATYDPTDFLESAQLPSDQHNPLEQWLYSAGPVCVPSSTQLSCTPLDSSHLNRHYPADAIAGLHPGLQPASLDFSKLSYQGPHQSLSYNGEPNLPYDNAPLDGGKLSPLMSENATSLLETGYNNSPGDVHNLRINKGYLSHASASGQPDLCSPSHHRSEPDPASHPRSSFSVNALASTAESSTSTLNREVPVDPKPNASSCLQQPKPSQDHSIHVQRVSVKQEQKKEKEVSFQSIGLQDITLDDVSEIIVRDLFQSPDSAVDSHSLT
ncbi:nuclear factor of activated T-cells, cytoplasmic 3 [Trichomycterus rosablanca]|uniref:nuclear factor of activated T-cells, cytoplasmic 3 n=1 Tax=Trichomycterus rosablanca TaxID=2290929 RepID=UPI002F353634